MKIAILSCGAVAGDVARRVAAGGGIDEMVVADLDEQLAQDLTRDLAKELSETGSSAKVSAAQFDAADPDSVAVVLRGADIVFNGVGPYYGFGQTVAEQAIAAGAHYVDVCDEYDTTQALVTTPRSTRQPRPEV